MSRYDHAELLAAVWLLGAGEKKGLPTSHGILDKALHQVYDFLPEGLKGALTFGVTGVGFRCYELPTILLTAQEALLTTEPNPRYKESLVTIDEDAARQIVVEHGLSSAEAKSIGEKLASAVDKVARQISRLPEEAVSA
jgi:hypothetical protein